jgi:SAM-dependent methyltransferase
MKNYGCLAACYDEFTTDVNYPLWADYLEKQFARASRPIHTILDLACGTGTLSWMLAERGYEMIGVDLSPEMLSQAMEKSIDTIQEAPIFLCQSMDELDLYGTVDACICMLDSVNHVINPQKLRRAFSRVHLFLEPGGLFLFDVLTPQHLENLDGGLFLDETEDAYCVWRTDYEIRRRICTYAMDLFLKDGDRWLREQEVHQEYAYRTEELTTILEEAGFCRIRQHGKLKMRPPKDGEGRVFFSAWKKG